MIIMDIADPIEAGPGYVLYTQEFYQFAQTKVIMMMVDDEMMRWFISVQNIKYIKMRIVDREWCFGDSIRSRISLQLIRMFHCHPPNTQNSFEICNLPSHNLPSHQKSHLISTHSIHLTISHFSSIISSPKYRCLIMCSLIQLTSPPLAPTGPSILVVEMVESR